MKNYDHKLIEKYIQKFWKKKKTFLVKLNNNKKKYYCLSMFPYPSGKLHLGHIRNYTIGDVLSRFNRMLGKNVLYPIGWDSYGLPAENTAIKNNVDPKKWTFDNINIMRKQLKILGFSFDWDKEIVTCDKNFYKWEQYLFINMYKKKYIYNKLSYVNWCNNDKTVLANEQVLNNKCWRCNNIIKIKYIKQWYINVKKYSDKLLDDMSILKNWPKNVLSMQKNWIGKQKYYILHFRLVNFYNFKIKVIFKNILEIMNIRYISLIKNRKLLKLIFIKILKYRKFKNIRFLYKFFKKKFFLKTNIIAFNEIINKFIPIIIFNKYYITYLYIKKNINNIHNYEYLLDKKKYIEYVIKNNIKLLFMKYNENCKYNFIIINKKNKIYDYKYINLLNIFKEKFLYNIKDWCISRQRYWGVSIPILYDINNNIKVLPKKYIPIKNKSFLNYYNNKKNKILINNKIYYLEKDTLDTFIQSSWYYIRYICNKDKKIMINKTKSNYWLPIDQYIGGIEHATMHLLYFRIYSKILKDLGFIEYCEPVKNLLCQGMILTYSYYYINKNKKCWVSPEKVLIKKYNNNEKRYYDIYNNKLFRYKLSKMSKSKNNCISPEKIINKYGSDVLRVFLIFMAPVEQNIIWDQYNNNILGIYKFLKKIWNIINKHLYNKKNNNFYNIKINYYEYYKYIYKIINNITYDLKIKKTLNTSISYLMKLNNIIINIINKIRYNFDFIDNLIIILLKMLFPFAPHITFFLWNKMGFSNIDYSNWPNKNDFKNFDNIIIYKIFINNKFKNTIKINNKFDKLFIINHVKKNIIYENNFKKIVFIKNKIINFIR